MTDVNRYIASSDPRDTVALITSTTTSTGRGISSVSAVTGGMRVTFDTDAGSDNQVIGLTVHVSNDVDRYLANYEVVSSTVIDVFVSFMGVDPPSQINSFPISITRTIEP